jgi:hypothetical protein
MPDSVPGIAVALSALVAFAATNVSDAGLDLDRVTTLSAAGLLAAAATGVVARPLAEALPRWTPVLVAVAVAGAYSTLPDTERVVALLGASVVGAAWAATGRGTYAGLGLVAVLSVLGWSIAVDGAARGSAVVGAVGALGVLVLWPAMKRVGVTVTQSAPTLVAIQAFCALLCGRVAGLRSTAAAAMIVVMLVWTVVVATLALASRRSPA